jgi:hypothetical protein
MKRVKTYLVHLPVLWAALLAFSLTFTGCGGQSSKTEEVTPLMEDVEQTESESKEVKRARGVLEDASYAVRKFNVEASDKNFKQLIKTYNKLETVCDNQDIQEEDKELAFQLDSLKLSVGKMLEANIGRMHKSLLEESDHLLSATEINPVYLRRGEKLFLDFETQGNVTVRVYNADNHSMLKTYTAKKVIYDSLKIANSAVYVVELKPVGEPYIELALAKSVASIEHYNESDPEITSEKTECSPKDFGAQKLQGIKLKSVFEEPRKVTLRSQGKSFFSGGNTRSVVAMQVPAGSTDVAYCLRISTSQSDMGADGQFCRRMDEKYKEIKLLGLPLYESHSSSSNIFRELLNACEPYREEEAYCNLFIFTSAAEAKKFSDGKPVSELKYNVDLSKKGTQSCNDRIPVKGLKTIYFGFENTRIRYSVYLWLESLATVPTTEYYRAKYVVKE